MHWRRGGEGEGMAGKGRRGGRGRRGREERKKWAPTFWVKFTPLPRS